MAWYDKYASGQASLGGTQYTPEEALEIRRMEFEQQMAERKATDKYDRKMARKERIRNRPRGSFKSKRKRAHWNWLADLEQRSPQAAAYYRYTQQRKGAQSRWKAAQKRRRRSRGLQRSAVAAPRRYTHDGKPIRHTKVGMSGAPQFMNLSQAGYGTPSQMGVTPSWGPNYSQSKILQRLAINRQNAISKGIAGGDGFGWQFDRNAGQRIFIPRQ